MKNVDEKSRDTVPLSSISEDDCLHLSVLQHDAAPPPHLSHAWQEVEVGMGVGGRFP
jgi:hypothetical protein